jgi:hypothetical protein
MPTKTEIIARDVHTVEKRGLVMVYGQTFPYAPHDQSSRRRAREDALRFGADHLSRMKKQAGRELSKTEQITGEFDRAGTPAEPVSARAQERVAEQIPDSQKIDGVLKPNGLTPGQIARRSEALGIAKARLLEKEQAQAEKQADATNPERIRLITFAEQCLASRRDSPKAKSSDVILWSDLVREARDPNKSVGATWQKIKSTTGIDMPARTVGEELPT